MTSYKSVIIIKMSSDKLCSLDNVSRLYFKITNSKENHSGFQYYDGLNILEDEFNNNPAASCVPGGLYFSDAENIFEFLDYGSYLREVTLPINDPDFKMVKDENNKWRANKIILGKRRKLTNVSTFEYLISHGANIHTYDDNAIRWASHYGHLEVVKLLISKGANIHAANNYALRWASENGHIEVVQLLISKGANIHANDDCAIIWAVDNGYLEIVKLLVEVVEFLISKGANIHACDD